HVGITQQTGTAVLTSSREYSKASSRGEQYPANLAPEAIPGAGAGPSRALPKTRSRMRKQKVLPPDFVPLWKQDLTPEQVKKAEKKMGRRELIDNLTEKVDAIVPEEGDEYGKRCMCRWPGCAGSAKRDADTGRHIKNIHLSRKVPCPKCGKRLRRDSVRQHINSSGCIARCHELEEQNKAETKVKRRAAEE
ncbi:hypothetical protein EWM64_g10678, partial [Hericium alpestre]